MRLHDTISTILLLLAFILFPAFALADEVQLQNGDRITGLVSSKGRKTLRLQTPHGVLTIALDKIDRVRRADGTEDVIGGEPPKPAPPPPPPKPAPPAAPGATTAAASRCPTCGRIVTGNKGARYCMTCDVTF